MGGRNTLRMRTVVSVTTLHLDWRLSRMRRVTYSWHKIFKYTVIRASNTALSNPLTRCLYSLRHQHSLKTSVQINGKFVWATKVFFKHLFFLAYHYQNTYLCTTKY